MENVITREDLRKTILNKIGRGDGQMSQTEFAEAHDIDPSLLSKFLNGDIGADRIAEKLGYSKIVVYSAEVEND